MKCKTLRRGTTNGYKWRVIANGEKFRGQLMTTVAGQCAVFGSDHDTIEEAIADVKRRVEKAMKSPSQRGCKFPAPKIIGGRICR